MTLPDDVKEKLGLAIYAACWDDDAPTKGDVNYALIMHIADAALASLGESGWVMVQGWRTMESAPLDEVVLMAWPYTDGSGFVVGEGFVVDHEVRGRVCLRTWMPDDPECVGDASYWMGLIPLPAIPTDTGAK